MIDEEGYRANVGIILANPSGKVLWAKRVGQDAWQFPQGGVRPDESPKQALFRELWEEIGLEQPHVSIIGCTHDWLRYRLPKHLIRHYKSPVCIGQKQRWYLLRLEVDESNVQLDLSRRPEFDQWCWVDYWHPVHNVVSFKREVYRAALKELEPMLHQAPNNTAHSS